MDDIHKLINHAKKNKEGFTVRMENGKIIPVRGTKKNRYSVAGDTSIVYTPKDNYIKTYSIPRRNGYYGGWYDKETGKYLIEHVNLYGNRNKALHIARNRKQKAIFDFVKMNDIKLHYKHRERITGMRIKTVPKKKMGDYVGLHGKLPKNELPKRFKNIPKKDVLIRAGLSKKRRKEVIAHEREEIPLMDKGMPYKKAHRKANEILRKRKHRPVAYRSKKGYINRLTGRHISRKTAQRLNRFFDEHPNATLYEANKGAVYDKNKSWAEQPEKLYKVYKRDKQLIKTKNRYGEDVYFSPLLDKNISKKDVKRISKFDYDDSGFRIHLYRITANKQRIYHIINYPLKRTLEEHDDINRLYSKLMGSWSDNASRIIKEIAGKYPIGKRDVMLMAFSHLIYTTSYGTRDNGAVTCFEHTMVMNANIEAMMPDEILKAMMKYHYLLNNYNRIFVKEVNITIYNFSNEKSKALAETRIGILRGSK